MLELHSEEEQTLFMLLARVGYRHLVSGRGKLLALEEASYAAATATVDAARFTEIQQEAQVFAKAMHRKHRKHDLSSAIKGEPLPYRLMLPPAAPNTVVCKVTLCPGQYKRPTVAVKDMAVQYSGYETPESFFAKELQRSKSGPGHGPDIKC